MINLERHFILPFGLMLILLGACKEKSVVKHDSPATLFPGLFEAVQSSRIFADSKTFPDCTPKRDPDDIIGEYQEKKGKPDFDVKKFVEKNFDEPEHTGNAYTSNIKLGVEHHIGELWDVLQRNPDKYQRNTSLINLPFPYIVPGGRFREVYYWDSYFTMLGLEESGRTDMIENMVNNFAYLTRTYGFIPNGNRTYYLTRSQPPFFSLMLKLFIENKKVKSDSILNANRDVLEKEYHFWMDSRGKKEGAAGHVVYLPDGAQLNRYFDAGDWPREEAYNEDVNTAAESKRPKAEIYRDLRSGAESGWDFSSRWFEDGRSLTSVRTTSIIPVDLNCLLYHLEQMLVLAYNRPGDKSAHAYIKKQSEERRNAILKYCWDPSTGWFRDYDWKNKKQTQSLNLAGVYPLYFRIASQEQAGRVGQLIQKQFLKAGGLVTTLQNTGQQWDSPNGWAPLQWMAIAGLNNYKHEALADEIASRWSKQNIRVFNKTGKLLEKYNVTDTTLLAGGGEYPNQDGFGWTNGVLLKILKMEAIRK